MVSGPTGSDDPVTAAYNHGRDFVASIAVGPDTIDLRSLSEARPQWPVWPQVSLERLVGPPSRRLQHLDLGWLHRFGVVVGVVDALSAAVGGPSGGPSALSLLVERAQVLGHHGWGTWSAGTSCRLLETADGLIAVNLPRDEDLAAVPALVEHPPDEDAWATLATGVARMPSHVALERADLLGLAVADVPRGWVLDAQRRFRGDVSGPTAVRVQVAGSGRRLRSPKVVDLSGLWAGPLAGWYLARAGALVTKVESTRRPDGARRGTPGFYRRLNANKTVVDLDLSAPDGRAELRRLVDDADIVIEASRPRAMEGFGIDPARHISAGGIWCAITGYGRSGPFANRVAFGDDAAAAGGLVTFVDGEPWFIGDAAADPIAGVTAAAGVLSLWYNGCSGLVDVAMRDAVAHLTGGKPVWNDPR